MLDFNSTSKFGPLIRLYIVLQRAQAIVSEEHSSLANSTAMRKSEAFPYILSILKLTSDSLFERCVMIIEMVRSEEAKTSAEVVEKMRFELLSHTGNTGDLPDIEVIRLKALIEQFREELDSKSKHAGIANGHRRRPGARLQTSSAA